MGIYDLPAQLSVIAEHSNSKKKVVYIGYSLGSTVSYVYASQNPSEAKESLAGIVSLAPVAYLSDSKAVGRVAHKAKLILVRTFKQLGSHSLRL